MRNVKVSFFVLAAVFHAVGIMAQSGMISGVVKDAVTGDPVPFANVLIEGTGEGTITGDAGEFELGSLGFGVYALRISFVGYKSRLINEIEVFSSRPIRLDVKMEPVSLDLESVEVVATPFSERNAESPLSLRSVGLAEIRRNPGGDRDISRVIQSFPGVTSGISFRNDLLIRGGAPNENRFYLDGVEVPVINHFATQGASGGPAGMINVDFIREVDFYSGAFPANRGNALSSVFEFQQRDGRTDRFGFTATLGASDAGISVEGPLGERASYLFSARRSYLQFLFRALGLPFLPEYTDFQAKVKTRIGERGELTFIGLGAIDDFALNIDAGVDEVSVNILDRLPVNTQWNYTNGIVYKHIGEQSVTSFVLSRSMLDNKAEKYLRNDDSDPDNLILDYASQEVENKLRVEQTLRSNNHRWNYGVNYEYARYFNRTYNRIFTQSGPQEIDFTSSLDMHKYGLFAQWSWGFLREKWQTSLGFRLDGNSYSPRMSNPLPQFSPRASVSYAVTDRWRINANAGIYYQLPPYTVMGYRANGVLVNREMGLEYIRSAHLVTGVEYALSDYASVSVELYNKSYSNYPFLLRDSVSLANLGGDFGVVGNEPAVSMGRGRTYGLEVLVQQRFFKGYYGILAYTFGRSEFEDKRGQFIPSSWDARHIVAFTGGKRFASNWEVGMRWRIQSGLPRTPFDERSSLVLNWDRNAGALLDYDRLNSERTGIINGLDLRVTKKWGLGQWLIEAYFDVQNLLGSAVPSETLVLDRPLDEMGRPIGGGVIVNPNAPVEAQRYAVKSLPDNVGTVLPTLGFVVAW